MVYKKTLIIVGVFAAIFAFSAFIEADAPKPEEFEATNLKVLPKNISKEALGEVMDSFKAALGVKCGFCHVASTSDPKKLDFASDENPHKETARGMMKMTQRLNKKYFNHQDGKTGAVAQIGCMTCHNGKEHPVTRSL